MCGAWTAVRRILAPVAWNTASKERVKFGPRSPGQRGEPHPVGLLVTHPAGVAGRHHVLVPEYQQFSILRQVRAEHQDGQAEYPAD